jgi:penicillin-binding protein 1A
MTNVHGIAVAGGTFPATIWHLFMQQAAANKPAHDFLLPNVYPTYKDWHGEWQYGGGTYVPTTPSYGSTTTATTTTQTTQTAPAPPAKTQKKDTKKKPPPPPPATTAPPPPTTTTTPAP